MTKDEMTKDALDQKKSKNSTAWRELELECLRLLGEKA